MPRYRSLALKCECGRKPDRVVDVGLTSDHQLLIQCWCSGCNKDVYALKDLAECWRDCPTTAGDAVRRSRVRSSGRMEDSEFLRSIGIAWEEDDS